MGKLIVIEGLDGSGKTTQIERLKQGLDAKNANYRHIKFPDYNDRSSTLIKMYLAGEFGTSPMEVCPYATSSFYAVDRYASYKRYWRDYYNEGGIVLSDRYVSSNAVHQTAKLPHEQWREYLDWLYDYEYEKIAIPKPDIVVYLDMPVLLSQELMTGRYDGDEEQKDIHERDTGYLENCRKAALFASGHGGWVVVDCSREGRPRTVEDIASEIMERVAGVL